MRYNLSAPLSLDYMPLHSVFSTPEGGQPSSSIPRHIRRNRRTLRILLRRRSSSTTLRDRIPSNHDPPSFSPGALELVAGSLAADNLAEDPVHTLVLPVGDTPAEDNLEGAHIAVVHHIAVADLRNSLDWTS